MNFGAILALFYFCLILELKKKKSSLFVLERTWRARWMVEAPSIFFLRCVGSAMNLL